MMEMLGGALAGAGAGVAAQKASDKLSQPKSNFWNELAWYERWEEQHSVLHRIEKYLSQIAEYEKEQIDDKPKSQVIVLQPGVFIRYQTYSKLYTMMFAAAAVQVQFNIPGLGNATLNLNAGWNVINLPDGSEVGLPQSASGNVNILYRASNVMYGSAV